MPMFHGEYQVLVKVSVVIEASDHEAAQKAVRGLSIDVDDGNGVQAHEWDVDPQSVYLFDGTE